MSKSLKSTKPATSTIEEVKPVSQTDTASAALETATDGSADPRYFHKIANMDNVFLPCMDKVGQPMTEDDVLIKYTFLVRQFTNNQNALAKARADGKNKTPQPDAAALGEMFKTYKVSIGDTPRQSALEKMKQEAAWRMWAALATEQTALAEAWSGMAEDARPEQSAWPIPKAVNRNTGAPNPVKPGFKPYQAKDADGKPMVDDKGKAVMVGVADQRESFCNRLLNTAEYADRINAMLEIVKAERGAKDTAEEQALVTDEDLI